MNRRARAQALLLARCGAVAQQPAPPALRALRDSGRAAFAAQGLPDTGLEDWRYSSTAPIVDFALAAAAAPDSDSDSGADAAAAAAADMKAQHFAAPGAAPAGGENRIVLAGGAPVFAESSALRALARPLASGAAPALLGALVDVKAHPFAALNAALLRDGVQIRIPAGELAAPIHLVIPATAGLSNPRIVIEAEAGSRAVVVQEHSAPAMQGASGESDESGESDAPDAAHFCNAVTEVQVGAGATLDFVLLQRGGLLASNLAVRQERDSHFASHTLSLGGRWVRNDLSLLLAGSGAAGQMNGLFLGLGGALLDNHTAVDHAVPQCTSRQLYKGVLGGQARGVFRGRVQVRPGAQQSDAQQSNPNLLLADGAEMDSKPQLEIHADDVKCSHGASMGRLDAESLFYLRARGIGEAEARAMLVRGFAAQIFSALPGALGAHFSGRLESAFARRLAAEAAR